MDWLAWIVFVALALSSALWLVRDFAPRTAGSTA
jgi:hypothetical protein